MNANLYVKILRTGLLTFIESNFEDNSNCRFQQDNDPKHTSSLARQFLNDNSIEWWKTPAESPDLNPIERVWSHLEQYLTHTYKPRNIADLINGKTVLEHYTINQCTKYINHIHKVVPVIIAKEGEPVVDDEL